MKIATEHFEHMQAAIHAAQEKHGPEKLAAYKAQLANDPKVKDLDKRYRWDLAHAAGLTPWFCSVVYPYANDTHIDTALRAIVKA